MRHTCLTLAAAVLLSVSQACAAEKTVKLIVENMTCASCPYIVRKTLTAVPGVMRADVSFEDKTAIVSFEDSQTSVAALVSATTEAGYPSHAAAPGEAL